MKKIFLLSFSLLFCSVLFAQNMKVTGRVVDTSGVTPIHQASIMAIHLRDSVLVRYTRSNSNGEFSMTDLPLDSFQIIIEHSNWTPRSIYLMGSSKKTTFELPDIRLYPKVQDVQDIVITRNRNAMYFSGDTLVFVADSFKVAENAVVEDLLKKLPGIKVEDDGSITSQGKEISQVLVDGDEFFGSDPTIATKNLAANGVESVQVYEKKNEDAAAGEDDKIQVLDLKLKDEAKRGYFGKAAVASDLNQGAADEAFYESELLFNKFDKTQKISVFMLASNTPKSSFGFGDMNKFGLDNERDASGMNFWDRDSRGDNSGIPQTLKTGIYYNDRLSEKVKLGLNYAYYDSRLQANSSSQTQYFLADSSYYTKDSTNNQTFSSSHRFNMNLQIDIDSLTKLELKPNVHFDEGNQNNTSINDFRDNNFSSYLLTNINNNYDSKGISSNSEAILRRKFGKKDRELEAKYILRYNDNSSDGQLVTRDSTNNTLSFDTINNQKKTNNNLSNTHYTTLTYTEPLSKSFLLTTEYFLEFGNSNQARYTYNPDLNNQFNIIDSLFTNDFVNERFQQRGTMMLTYLYKSHRITGGLGFRNIQIDNINQFSDVGINQNISNFLPNFAYQFKPSMAKRINIRYSTYSAPPSANDLQPVRDNTNPNRIQEGNPDLKPNYQHQLNFNANIWQAMTGRYIWSGGNATFTQNAFGNSTTFDQLGRTISKTINVDGNMFATIYAGGGYPILNRKLTFEPSFNASYFRNNNFINNQLNATSTTTLNGSFSIELSLDSLELNIGTDYTYVNPVTTLSAFSNQPYSTQNYFMTGDWRFPAHFRFKWELNYTMNRGRADAFNRDIFIVDLEVQKAFLKTENLILGLSINDLLNQNINLQRTVSGNMITDNYTRIITRYFLLRLTYKFNNNKKPVKKIFVCGISALLLSLQAWAQTEYIHAGKITFERRTNLEKRFKDERMKRFVTEENKIRTEPFMLYFNDTASYFAVVPSNEPEEMAWLTTKNAYYQNLKDGQQLMMLAVFGQNVYVQDSLPVRTWKITDGKRTICGYECRKAIYQKNDSTRLYAWYTPMLTPSVGPEGFCGLPGTILGLATEDGGIVYFAKKIDLVAPKKEELLLNPGKNKVFTIAELRQKIEKEYGNTPWGKRLFDDLFRWL